jgi:hypothetical protein
VSRTFYSITPTNRSVKLRLRFPLCSIWRAYAQNLELAGQLENAGFGSARRRRNFIHTTTFSLAIL